MTPVKLMLLVFGIYIIQDVVREILYLRTTYFRITKTLRIQLRSDKGKFGEYLIWQRLKTLEKDGVKFLFNAYLPRDKGRTTEIDVLMLAPQGIFVFESKNYSGWIFGSEKSHYWTQTLPAGRNKSHKEHFLNPIHQNALHIRCLKELLGSEEAFRSIIVFSDRCELKKLQVDMSGTIQIIKLANLPNIVCSINWGTPLTMERIAELYEKLLPYTRVSKDVKAQHVAEIRSRLEEAEREPAPTQAVEPAAPAKKNVPEASIPEEPVTMPSPPMQDALKCPRCGGTLVLRTARRGSSAGSRFYGCSNFPDCRYTRNINTKTEEKA